VNLLPKGKPKQSKAFARLIAALCIAVVWTPTTAFALSDNRTSTDMPKIAAKQTSPIEKSYLEELGIESVGEQLEGIAEFKLKANGMRVLLAERHETPVVATTIVYHVGSRNEAVGYTGSTHFLEHMMFKGTPTFDPLKKTGIDDVLKKVGGINNATTWYDRTNYYEMVPAAHLDLCIKIEADRIRNLLLRESDRQAEMTVVRNELERGEDSPGELLESNLFSTAFKEHPYHHPVIGWRSDVEGVPTARLKKFYDDFYYPDNATLIIIGDFQSKEALKLIAENFNSIPKAPHEYPAVYTTEPPQEGERRFTVRRGIDLPRVSIGFHIPECLSKDTYALDVIQTILGDSSKRSSRLYKRLVETGMAAEVSCYAYSLKDPGLFVVSAQSNVGVEPSKLEAAILDELNKISVKGVTDQELSTAKKSITKSLRLSIADPMGLSGQLTEAISAANWRWWVEYPSNIEKVTNDDVKAALKRFYYEDNRTVGFYFPKTEKGKKGKNSAEDQSEKKAAEGEEPAKAGSDAPKHPSPDEIKPESDKGKTPTEAAAEPAKDGDDAQSPGGTSNRASDTSKEASRIAELISAKPKHAISIGKNVKRFQMKNGMTVLVLPLEGSSTVAISGRLNAGDHFCDLAKSQVPFFVAELLNKGSKKFSKEALADELENMGTSLEFSSGSFWTDFDTQVVKEDLDKLMEIVSDTLRNPLFPADELKLEKKLRLSDLNENLADTGDMSWNAFLRALYKPTNGFYQKDFNEQIAELNSISQKDLKAFHDKHYIPANFVLSMVGDVSEEEAKALCDKYLDSWTGGPREQIAITKNDINEIKKADQITVEIPDKSNADVVIGKAVSVDLLSKEYFATIIGNAALGYDSFSCRLAPVRDKYGLTYGISSSVDDPTKLFGPWTIKFSVAPENLKRAQEIVSGIVKEYLKEGITPSELQTEKSHLSGVFSVYLRSPRHIASRLSFYELAGVDMSYIDNYPSNLDKVTVDDVNNAIRKHFDLDDAITSVSGTMKPKKK
jgi:zinc protease